MRPQSIEWPTLAVAAAIGAGFVTVLTVNESLPVSATIALLAVLGAWYSSLQHEVIHGHPTPWSAVNTALAIIPLGLVDSFPAYRTLHLAHHANPTLGDPLTDPESFYVTVQTWDRCGPLRRAFLITMSTLAGRLVLGPLVKAVRMIARAVTAMRTPRAVAGALAHVLAVTAVLGVVTWSGVPLWTYLVGVVWGGGALTLLRSFAEHRVEISGTRSAVVHTNLFFSLLYLNNNLHHTHHARPGIAWFAIPAANERLGSDRIAASGAGLYRGYGEIVRRYGLRPFDHPAINAS